MNENAVLRVREDEGKNRDERKMRSFFFAMWLSPGGRVARVGGEH